MKKYILLLLCATFAMQAQTYQNPTFGTVKTKTSPTVTSVNHLATVEADGTLAKIDPVNLPFTIGTGTINTLPLFTGTKTLGNSILSQNSDGLKIGSQNTTYGVGLSVSKLLTAINKHTFDDYSVINTVSGNEGFGVFDASTEMTGSNSNDHLNGYQSRLNYSASVGMTGPNFNIYGMTAYLAQNRITGTGHLTVAKGFFARDLGGASGTVDNLYGLHIDPQTKGSITNWDIHATGKNNHFGAVMIGGIPAQWNTVDSFVNTGSSNFSGLTKHTSQVRISSPSNTVPALQIGDYVGSFGWGIFESNTTGNLFINSKNSGAVVTGIELQRSTGNIGIGASPTTDKLNVVGNAAGSLAASNTNHFMRKGETDTALGLKANLASPALTGTPTAPTPTIGSGIANKDYVDANARPYKVYTALLTQTGTSAPVATVMENTLGALTFGYTSTGVYTITSSSLFTAGKTITFVGGNSTGVPVTIKLQRTSSSNISFLSFNGAGSANALSDTAIEIRVYN